MTALRRVVCTGIGVVSPLGCGSDNIFSKLMQGRSGITEMSDFSSSSSSSSSDLKTMTDREAAASLLGVAGLVPYSGPDCFNSLDLVNSDKNKLGKLDREMALYTQYALRASDLALLNAKILSNSSFSSSSIIEELSNNIDVTRCGVAIASGIGAINEVVRGSRTIDTSPRKLSPYFVPKILMNMAAGHMSLRYGFQGPNHMTGTACAAGAHAIGDAFNFIRLDYADMMLAGGSEASIGMLGAIGFNRLRALSSTGSRPFDIHRDGFVMGEGSAVLVLEELSHALNRNANIIAEIIGYGLSGDGYHMTAPSPHGHGAYNAMKQAIKVGNITKNDVDYINAHATSTPIGDEIELHAIDRLFCKNDNDTNDISCSKPLYVSSTKGATGHMLGAAGAFEAAVTCWTVNHGLLPPTVGLKNPVVLTDDDNNNSSNGSDKGDGKTRTRYIEHVTTSNIGGGGSSSSSGGSSSDSDINYAMSNSFGFGGTNASLLFRRYHHEDKQ